MSGYTRPSLSSAVNGLNTMRTLGRKAASSFKNASIRTGIAAGEAAPGASAAMEEAGLRAVDAVSNAARTASTVMEEAASGTVGVGQQVVDSSSSALKAARAAATAKVSKTLSVAANALLTIYERMTNMFKPDKIDDTLKSMKDLLDNKTNELSKLVKGFKDKLSDDSLQEIFKNDSTIKQMQQVLSDGVTEKRELLVELARDDQLKIEIINKLLPSSSFQLQDSTNTVETVGGGKNKYSKQKGGEETEMAVFIVLTLWGLYSAPLVMILFVLSGGWTLMAMIASKSDSLIPDPPKLLGSLGLSSSGGQKRLGRKSKKNKMVKKKRTIKSRKLVKYNSN